MKKFIPYIFIAISAIFLFSFKILSTPPSLETDEGSIAYNSALISQTYYDQNGKHFPFFILSSDKHDWKQPFLIYSTALVFKIFGISLLSYKLVNVFFTTVAIILFFIILKILFKKNLYAIIGSLLLISSPIIIITTRIGNESILQLFFSTLWLLSLLLFKNKKQIIFLILNALTLGISFYAFKGMRVIVPIWTIISCFFILGQHISFKNYQLLKSILNKSFLIQIFVFVIFILPFFLIIPYLEKTYPGSIFDYQKVSIDSIYTFFYYWLSNLGLSFWYTTPDIGKIYLVKDFGAILLITLPFFITGIYQAIKKISFFTFILLCFVVTPSLFSIAHSIDYTHRLICCIPFLIIITTLGFKTFFEKNNLNKKYIYIFATVILFLTEFFQFFRFYYFEYPNLNTTIAAFGQNSFPIIKALSKKSKELNFTPYIQEEIFKTGGDEYNFYNIAYFNSHMQIWRLDQTAPNKAVVLTQNSSRDNFYKYEDYQGKIENYNILISKDNY